MDLDQAQQLHTILFVIGAVVLVPVLGMVIGERIEAGRTYRARLQKADADGVDDAPSPGPALRVHAPSPGDVVESPPAASAAVPSPVPPESGATPTSVPPESGATPTSVPPESGATPTSVPPESGATPTSVPPESSATPTSEAAESGPTPIPEATESAATPIPEAAESGPAAAEPPPSVPLRERLARTHQAFVGRLTSLLPGRKVDADLLDELEALLFTADLGVETAQSLLDTVKKEAAGGDAESVRGVLRSAIASKLERVQPEADGLATQARPHVVLVLGVNGSGKTTTIGKLAARYAGAGKKVILGAGDTFRAAAIEQLQIWGERAGCEVIAGQAGGDPASVAFDTVKAAVARGADVAIIDTAGRLQTKRPLMEELEKISRVIAREIPEAPHESLLVLDSNTGQNAISQAELFTEVANVTGLVLTKLDGTAKGGVIVGLADRFAIPVKYVGVGEGVEDLRDFESAEFVGALFGDT